jgi:hypothetical protein
MTETDAELDGLFVEPLDYYQNEKPHSFVQYLLHNGHELRLRLIGQSPLWVSHGAQSIITLYF